MPVELGGSSTVATASADQLAELQDINANTDGVEGKLDTLQSDKATATNQTATNSKLDTLLAQTDGLELSTATTATNTGTTATNTTAIAGSVVTTDTAFVSNGVAVSATVKSGTGTLYSVYAHNNNASTTLYLWLSNSLSAGGTLMVAPIKLVAGAQLFLDSGYFTSDGHDFSTGFTWGFSTSPSTYSAHGTVGDCIISGMYE